MSFLAAKSTNLFIAMIKLWIQLTCFGMFHVTAHKERQACLALSLLSMNILMMLEDFFFGLESGFAWKAKLVAFKVMTFHVPHFFSAKFATFILSDLGLPLWTRFNY